MRRFAFNISLALAVEACAKKGSATMETGRMCSDSATCETSTWNACVFVRLAKIVSSRRLLARAESARARAAAQNTARRTLKVALCACMRVKHCNMRTACDICRPRALTSVLIAAAIVLRLRGEHLALRALWTAQEDCAIFCANHQE